jgi:hypothetical protein
MDPTVSVHQILCRSRKKCNRDPGNNQKIVEGRKHEPYTGSPNSPRSKKARQVKSQVTSMVIIFFDIKRIVRKEFVLSG